MKTSTMLIVGGAAVGVFLLMRSKAAAAATNPLQNRVIGRVPLVRFAAQDPNSLVNQVNYYVNNPDAQPWDFLKLTL